LELRDGKKGWAQIKVSISEKTVKATGIVHGGGTFSLADSTFGVTHMGFLFDALE
jgi:acyl-coenzyme A thioesterase PaaI-like protein